VLKKFGCAGATIVSCVENAPSLLYNITGILKLMSLNPDTTIAAKRTRSDFSGNSENAPASPMSMADMVLVLTKLQQMDMRDTKPRSHPRKDEIAQVHVQAGVQRSEALLLENLF
jgi:hypothetical protein